MDITINYLAVVAAGVVAYAVGAVWYSPIGFGKYWMKLMGFTPESMRSMPLTPAQAMSIGFVVFMLMSYVLAHFVVYTGADTWGLALQLGFWAWLGLMLPVIAGGWLWEGKSFKLFAFNAAYYLVSIEVMALVLGLWH